MVADKFHTARTRRIHIGEDSGYSQFVESGNLRKLEQEKRKELRENITIVGSRSKSKSTLDETKRLNEYRRIQSKVLDS
jgi:hypothetical protein